MSTDDTNNKKCKDCDDPCDDCTNVNVANLSGWISTKKKPLDNDDVK